MNGRIEDLRIAVKILKGRKVKKGFRCIIFFVIQNIYKQVLKEGFIEIFIDVGCVVLIFICGLCFGGYMGILVDGEKVFVIINRNFVGRMGYLNSEVYLLLFVIAAVLVVLGYIGLFEEFGMKGDEE